MAESQRPHVARNDALLFLCNAEHLFGIDAGAPRVGEAVHLKQTAQAVESAGGVPVVQIKIMQQRTHCQRSFVGVEMQVVTEPCWIYSRIRCTSGC